MVLYNTCQRLFYPLLFLLIFSSCGNNTVKDGSKGKIPSADGATSTEFADSLLIEKTTVDTVDVDELHKSPAHQSSAFQLFYNRLCNAFQSEDPAKINEFIHPKWGIYYVDRPGAIDVVDSAHKIESFFKKVYLGPKRLKGMACTLQSAKIPDFTCDKEYKGCLTEEAKKFHRISDLKTALKEYGFNNDFSAAEKQYLEKFEGIITRNVVNFDKAIGLSFVFIDGKWYLAIIDLARYSCSA